MGTWIGSSTRTLIGKENMEKPDEAKAMARGKGVEE